MNANNIDCEKIREIIDGLSSGAAHEVREEWFQAHLESCPDCRKLHEEAVILNRALDAWEAPKPSKNIQARVMAGIAQLEKERAIAAEGSSFIDRIQALFQYRFRIPALALLLILALLAGSLIVNIIMMRRPAGSLELAREQETPVNGTVNVADGLLGLVTATPGIGDNRPGIVKRAALSRGSALAGAGIMQPAMVLILGMPPSTDTYPATIHVPDKISDKENAL